jgi:hypothetical protein
MARKGKDAKRRDAVPHGGDAASVTPAKDLVEGEGEAEVSFTINPKYAAAYEERKKAEELGQRGCGARAVGRTGGSFVFFPARACCFVACLLLCASCTSCKLGHPPRAPLGVMKLYFFCFPSGA